jgi:hypothetical protein
LDPVLTSDGRLYGPERFKEIVKERYLISKQVNTSYEELGDITPLERKYLLGFIKEDLERKQELVQEAEARNKT